MTRGRISPCSPRTLLGFVLLSFLLAWRGLLDPAPDLETRRLCVTALCSLITGALGYLIGRRPPAK